MGNTHFHFFVCASVAQLEEEEGGAIDGRREGQHHQHYIHTSTPAVFLSVSLQQLQFPSKLLFFPHPPS